MPVQTALTWKQVAKAWRKSARLYELDLNTVLRRRELHIPGATYPLPDDEREVVDWCAHRNLDTWQLDVQRYLLRPKLGHPESGVSAGAMRTALEVRNRVRTGELDAAAAVLLLASVSTHGGDAFVPENWPHLMARDLQTLAMGALGWEKNILADRHGSLPGLDQHQTGPFAAMRWDGRRSTPTTMEVFVDDLVMEQAGVCLTHCIVTFEFVEKLPDDLAEQLRL
jgi:hypothetical protein